MNHLLVLCNHRTVILVLLIHANYTDIVANTRNESRTISFTLSYAQYFIMSLRYIYPQRFTLGEDGSHGLYSQSHGMIAKFTF